MSVSRVWPYTPIYALERFLLRYSELDPEPVCWLGGDDADRGFNYCRSCAEKIVAAGKAEFVDGGWDGHECDSVPYCEGCDCLLNASLTRHGVLEEMDYYKRSRSKHPLNQHDAWHIARLLLDAPDNEWIVRFAEKVVAEIVRAQS